MVASPAAENAATAAEVMRLALAYQAARLIHVAAELRLADLLVQGPRHAEDLAAAVCAHPPSLRRLLRALVAHGVCVEGSDGRFGLGPLGAPLVSDAAHSVRDLVLMWGDDDFWESWGRLARSVRTGETGSGHDPAMEDAFARYAGDRRLRTVFGAGMNALSVASASAVVAACEVSAAALVVDVGGGHGRLLAEVLRASAASRGILLERAEVVPGAEAALAAAGVRNRCEIVAGDMFARVPPGGDLYLVKSVLHDWDDARAVTILLNCRRAMDERPGARLLIVERVLPERAEATPDAPALMLADLNMLVRTGGRERTRAEFHRLLDAAGLRFTRVLPTTTQLSVIEAVRA